LFENYSEPVDKLSFGSVIKSLIGSKLSLKFKSLVKSMTKQLLLCT
jgi:hypothetical protein